jgi:DNA polymerase-3 subunit epsilon
MYAIVDIETTGTNATYNCITEVAIYVHDGDKIVDEWHSLINPKREIPPFIIQMTGITNEMVADAPEFADVAEEIYTMLHDKIFVAHNAGFDYGFIKSHLLENGYELKSKKLCTVRLSRKIFPGFKSYSLGRLCESLGVQIENRHRAAGDALATAKIFGLLIQKDTGNHVTTALKRNSKEQLLPPNMEKAVLEQLPEACGVYYFHDAAGKIIYVGKAINIKSRIFGHFTYADYHGKENDLRNSVFDITYTLTGNELIALLLESEEIKRKFPKFNNAQNNGTAIIVFLNTLTKARNYLNEKMHAFQLCGKYCHLQKVKKACYNHELGICLGACVEKENPETYNERAEHAIAAFRDETDTYFIVGKGRAENEKSVIYIDKGHYLGFGFFDADWYNGDPEILIDVIKWRPDTPDVQRILSGYISRHAVTQGLTIIPKA